MKTAMKWLGAALLSCLVLSRIADAQLCVSVSDNGFGIGAFLPDPVHIVTGMAVCWDGDHMGPDAGGSYLITGDGWSYFTPCEYQFLAAGTYAYHDDNGSTGTVYVSDNVPPMIAITSPVSQAVFSPPASFTFAVNASDIDADGMRDVQFYVGSNQVDDVYVSPWSTLVTNLTAGSYTLTAIAYDYGGASASNSITISVQAPQIALSEATIAASQFRFAVTGLTIGKTNCVEISTNPAPSGAWTAIATNVAQSSTASFTNPVVGNSLFFRLHQLP